MSTMKQHKPASTFSKGGWHDWCRHCEATRPVTQSHRPKGPWTLPDGTPAPWCQGKATEQKA